MIAQIESPLSVSKATGLNDAGLHDAGLHDAGLNDSGSQNSGAGDSGAGDSGAGDILQDSILPCLEGMVQVFTSAHRSFYTNVMSRAIQTAAQGTPVLLVQFLKGGIGMGQDHPIRLCQDLTWLRCGLSRCIATSDFESQEQVIVFALWEYTKAQILADRFSLVILDELSLAINLELIPEADVLALMRDRPKHLDLVLTGPDMPNSILDLADQITELRRSIYA